MDEIKNNNVFEELNQDIDFEEKSKEITMPEEIADFWLKPIEHPIDDLCFDIFYVDKNGNWQKVNFPPDPKTGKITPPFTTDEILNFGFGEGKYIFRPKSIKTGKLLKGSETHYLSKKTTQEQEIKEVSKKENDSLILILQQMTNLQTLIVKQMEQSQALTRELLFKILDNMTKQPQVIAPQPHYMDMSKILASFASVLRETEKSKSEVEKAKILSEKEIELKKLEFKSKIDELLAQLGKYPETDEIRNLKQHIMELENKVLGEKEKKKPGVKEMIESFINGATEFIESLIPLIRAIQQMQSQRVQSYSSVAENSNEMYFEEETIEEEIPQEILEEIKQEEIKEEPAKEIINETEKQG